MKLHVKLFARARDLAGTGCAELDLADAATVADLRRELSEQYPELRPLVPNLLVAVGMNYVADSEPLQSGAEIACFPPVSGG